jgi:hypothetical protein
MMRISIKKVITQDYEEELNLRFHHMSKSEPLVGVQSWLAQSPASPIWARAAFRGQMQCTREMKLAQWHKI